MNENSQAVKMVYCPFCGAKLNGADGICTSCGKVIAGEPYAGIPRTGAAGKGYAEVTDHPSYEAYRKRTGKLLFILLPAIAVIITVILIIMGTNPMAAIAGGIILLIVMLLVAIVQGRKKPDWQGTVVSKSHSHYRRKGADHKTWTIRFQTDDGKKISNTWRTYPALYDYLKEGDAVRYLGSIGGPNAYEKYDKSEDDVIPCPCCGLKMDPRYDFCTICGAKLLKNSAG